MIPFLSGNALKLIAAAAMLCDHAGLMLLPRVSLLRIIGRLAYPIFAFMIAEGCKYTRSRRRYFGMIFLLATVCQAVYFVADGTLYLSVLFTFSLSILTIYALQFFKTRKTVLSALVFVTAVAVVWGLNQVFVIDYGFWGCMVPVFATVFHDTRRDTLPLQALMLALGLIPLSAAIGGIQWFSLLTLPLLLCYNGKRGRMNLKYFFYIFYPVHLAVLQAIAWCMA